MKRSRFLILMCFMLMLGIVPWGVNQVWALPAHDQDATKVPHYYGPYPNWALSPLRAAAPVCSLAATPCNTDADCPQNETCTGKGIEKFVDTLPLLNTANNLGQQLTVAVADKTTYPGSDYYEIGLVQYRQKMHTSLPASLLRGYVQLWTPALPAQGGPATGVALTNATLAGGTTAINSFTGVAAPHYLGPVIVATKGTPVRIVFRNLLPTGLGGNLFLPVDTTLMGSGEGQMPGFTPTLVPNPNRFGTVMDADRNPLCSEPGVKNAACFTDNRATLHLHGGVTPWISDGTPHQWITPAGEGTSWPEGVSVENVPDMDVCGANNDGCMTFYYTNQQSARLMFYHDHAWGITRLNVYAGEAAGYVITDDVEKSLLPASPTNLTGRGLIPADMIPLIIQDRTFVPSVVQLAELDPTWDATRWGGEGNLWYHHVYMPAQNQDDPTGMSAYGRWMYGPYFWPPAYAKYPPIVNPYYDVNCDPNVAPFCEPYLIPGTPNIAAGMEQFNDTPIVNGTAYPTHTVEPKAYRLRILNAANDRFFNLQWYVGDAATASVRLNSLGVAIGATEVALNSAELALAQNDPVVFPTPFLATPPAGPESTSGPDWIQIGNEGGFLPTAVVIDGQQPTTWITDPTRFDVGNVDLHSLLLAPAERADVIVDFSAFRGQTLILYNDAPAAFPARVPSYDYYTGGPDLYPVGAPTILPGYGPNTRTIMQVKVADTAAAPAFGLAALQNAFNHNVNAPSVFESGQHPIIVGQAAYNPTYGTSFVASGNCNGTNPTQKCDGYARISDLGPWGFNTLLSPAAKVTLGFEPKAIHDEMNSTTFDEYGRMQANLGLEKLPPLAGQQNVMLMPYTSPPTELIDGTNLPEGMTVTPISDMADGTQIWRITHNGVDTHPIHFHLYDVQVLNRVAWDNNISPPDPNELGWKETVRINPLQDTFVALRPVIPTLPFDLPNSIRLQHPAMASGNLILGAGVNGGLDPNGVGVNIRNNLVNFGWEYVYHCHILSHEEMDMMRPVVVAIPPVPPTNLAGTRIAGANRAVNLSWTDASKSETAFEVWRSTGGGAFALIATLASFPPAIATFPQTQGPATGPINYSDTTIPNDITALAYQVRAINVVGDGATAGFDTLTVVSAFTPPVVPTGGPAGPTAPTGLTATGLVLPLRVVLNWTDRSNNERSFAVWRSVNGGPFSQIGTVTRTSTQSTATGGPVTFTNVATGANNVVLGNTYTYYVTAIDATGVPSAQSNQATVSLTPPAAPTNLSASAVAIPGNRFLDNVEGHWTDNANNETSFQLQRSTGSGFISVTTFTFGANVTAFNQNVSKTQNFYYRVRAVNVFGNSAWSNVVFVVTP